LRLHARFTLHLINHEEAYSLGGEHEINTNSAMCVRSARCCSRYRAGLILSWRAFHAPASSAYNSVPRGTWRRIKDGLDETKHSVAAKIGRGTFPATFFFVVMKAIGRESISLADV
jgi:hypothetical protein